MTKFRILLVILLGAVIAGVFWFDLYQYLTIEFFSEQQEIIQNFVQENLLLSVCIFFTIYVSATAISLPVGVMLSLSAGALFGVLLGTVVVSFASTLGATLAFLASRFVLQDFVDRHFSKVARVINEGILRDGPYYLFSLRLIPVFPYFVINLVMGLTHMPVRTFAWVSQLGLLPITLVLTNAGDQISLVKSFGDIMSPVLMGSLILVGLFPLITKKMLSIFQSRKSV
jgi:uncharacterized membrane protein YdjX (TVP38/TMEM64 family)